MAAAPTPTPPPLTACHETAGERSSRPTLTLVPTEPLPAPPLSEFVRAWLAVQPHLRASSLATYRSWLKNHIDPLVGFLPVDEVGDEEVRAFAVALRERLSSTTASSVLTLLRAALDEACVAGYLTRNPARSLPRWLRPGRNKPPRRILTESEITALLDAAGEEWERALFATCVFAGLRSGEARGLRWGDIDFDAQRSGSASRRSAALSGCSRRTPPSATSSCTSGWRTSCGRTRSARNEPASTISCSRSTGR
jgi:Phage integrase family